MGRSKHSQTLNSNSVRLQQQRAGLALLLLPAKKLKPSQRQRRRQHPLHNIFAIFQFGVCFPFAAFPVYGTVSLMSECGADSWGSYLGFLRVSVFP